ncbi:Oidioi.mRNA.OKI2018_I69.chr2.g4056.t1.cds [Oikopleura dioica]|uniref:Oidioi.mRNA.OKI2018_I69.chr2.g4056.t1.cds n=1 Tax=Oikopleura dioica TaxID=34765 RepID=A0ABN7SXR4_OIKDI|nr:Oidioi.mRNA.OKI2018_I69.chr2.g4056.t1.cds [Oikopleura dioica]
MKVLAAVISAAATAQSLEDRGSATAWTSIEASYNSLYDAILAEYSTTNIPGVKKANRLRDFLNKVDNFPTRVSDSCANFADLDSCSTVVDSCEFNPVVGSQKTVLSAARNYKVSADILCPDINEWKYNIHLSGNDDPYATPTNAGDRQFSVITSPDSGSMEISLTDPSAWDKRQSFMQPCTIGEWNTYSLEVNQVDEDPSTLRWVFNFDGTQAAQGTYDLSGAYSSGDLNAFVFDLIPNSVRNFSYQTFDDICLLKNEQVFTIRARTSSSVSHAQTDGTVNFQIPKAGCDTWFNLDDPNQPDDREPGQIDTYVIDVSSLPASCLENLGDIRIWEEDDDGWYPDWFEVTVVDKTACTTTVYSYEGLQWVDFGETSYSQNAAPVVTQS